MTNPLPDHYELPLKDSRTALHNRLCEALHSLPHHFKTQVHIEGLPATDLFSLNTLLGSAIETQAVEILNELRTIWDPQNQWGQYRFIRFPESYPDVRLVLNEHDEKPIIGIELKGWYLLSKEKEPSFRFKASADANSPWDLIACYPWALSNLLSGSPKLYKPYVEQAKYAADMRTFYWQNRKGINESRSHEITHPETAPYPSPGSKYVDVPQTDSGNFGRIARIPGLMTDWTQQSLQTPLMGIEARHWISFLSVFVERKNETEIEDAIAKIVETLKASASTVTGAEDLETVINRVINALKQTKTSRPK